MLENRVDLELERQGNILTQGRNEPAVLAAKREMEQKRMREDLQRQIDEKAAKKEAEKSQQKRDEMTDEIRVRQ